MSDIHKKNDALFAELNQSVIQSKDAFEAYKNASLEKRKDLLFRIAVLLKEHETSLIEIAGKETHLTKARLKTELDRTIFQLTNYGEYCAGGEWLNACIDTPGAERRNKTDVRKTMLPLGPVAIFGASNFPFAYSTPGGDTASALAAGCTVIVKAHPGHPETSTACAGIISKALADTGLPAGIFTHISDTSYATGEYLVKHPLVKAVGFTGSFSGGKQLFDWANQRKEPIPVFAEMGSLNPIFILPERLNGECQKIADELFASITLSMGQFCTKPGLIIGIQSKEFSEFTEHLSRLIKECKGETMLHNGISDNYHKNKSIVVGDKHVAVISESAAELNTGGGVPTIAEVNSSDYLQNPDLHREVFGPFSLIIVCRDKEEMKRVAESLEGQLTATLIGSEKELKENTTLLDILKSKAGRIIINGVPTGVEVCLSMHHGGPFPATTDSRFTSVGADSIKRFARPVSFQNCPEYLLPEEIKNSNPLHIWRRINGQLTKESVSS